ncbi:MAG: hypothetical protein AAFX96_05155 [Pseudomonadota bacterium]
MTNPNTSQTQKYFSSLGNALDGLDTYLRDEQSPAQKHHLIASVISEYLTLMHDSLDSWESKVTFQNKFRISQTESGFPAFQNVLDLQNDSKDAEQRLSELRDPDVIRKAMVDHILTQRTFPVDLQKQMAERHYLELVQAGSHFAPLVLPKTVKVSVNPKTKRPFYVVHWGYYDESSIVAM